jgi:hypothetical protein
LPQGWGRDKGLRKFRPMMSGVPERHRKRAPLFRTTPLFPAVHAGF